MQARQNNNKTVEVSQQGFLCSDLVVLISILLLYLNGIDQSCGIEAAQILLIYIIIKASFIGVRCCQCFVLVVSPNIGLVMTVIWTVVWMLGISVYYVWVLTQFFKDSNDCREYATTLWIGLLIVTIESIAFLVIIAVALLVLLCCIPRFLRKK